MRSRIGTIRSNLSLSPQVIAINSLAAKAARIQEALATITDIGHAVGNAAARPAFVIMEKLHEKNPSNSSTFLHCPGGIV
jgi:hypothetical protein